MHLPMSVLFEVGLNWLNKLFTSLQYARHWAFLQNHIRLILLIWEVLYSIRQDANPSLGLLKLWQVRVLFIAVNYAHGTILPSRLISQSFASKLESSTDVLLPYIVIYRVSNNWQLHIPLQIGIKSQLSQLIANWLCQGHTPSMIKLSPLYFRHVESPIRSFVFPTPRWLSPIR